MKIDQGKLRRQEAILERWRKANGKGTLEACTGFGKTYVGVLAIRKTLAKNPGLRTLVVVPQTHLQEEWIKSHIPKHKLAGVTPLVINSVMKVRTLECDLLVLDEIHRYAAEEWIQIFQKIKYRWILGLTGTLERQDERHHFLSRYAPVIDRVDLQEALENKWVSPVVVINYGIQPSEELLERYKQIDEDFHRFFGWFNHNFWLAKECSQATGRRDWKRILIDQIDPRREMSDERLQAAFDKTPDGILRKHVEFVGKDPDNWDDVQEVKGYAVNFMRAMGARKNVLYEAPEKIDVTCQLIEDFGDRNILTFAERTETANELYKRTSQYAVSYHSKMKPHIRKAALKAFPKTANVLHTSRALDEGFNVEGVNMGIVLSGTSTKRQAVQRVGRTIRFVEGKTAVFIELYIRSTQDRKWLEARQKGLKGVLILECFDYDDLVQRIKTYST